MANQEHLAILKQGVEVWNQWRKEHPDILPDLSEADMSRMHLIGFDFTGANLTGARLVDTNFYGAKLASISRKFGGSLVALRVDLVGADLRRASLSEVDLSQANLTEANLEGANLGSASLFGAKLNKANLNSTFLYYTNFNEAELYETSFYNARLLKTLFGDVDLSKAEGLETVRPEGPLIIGIEAIYRSRGRIPEMFLQGAGAPDSMIEYMRSLVSKPVDYYSCFISYSSKDQDFAERLHADLQAKGVRCWFASHDMKIGDRIRDRIDESIRLYDKLLLILSEHSMMSEWVEDEVEAALEKEGLAKEQGEERTVLFPVRLDDAVKTTKKAWAAKLRRQRHIGNFTCWKDHDAYQKAFTCLLRDLKTGDQKMVP